MKTLLTTTAAALLIAGAAYAEDTASGGMTDMNDQMTIDQQSMDETGVDRATRSGATVAGAFDDWDTNQDQYLSREEYEAGVASHESADQLPEWDELSAERADEQGRLSRQDFEDSISNWYPTDATTTGTSESLGGSK